MFILYGVCARAPLARIFVVRLFPIGEVSRPRNKTTKALRALPARARVVRDVQLTSRAILPQKMGKTVPWGVPNLLGRPVMRMPSMTNIANNWPADCALCDPQESGASRLDSCGICGQGWMWCSCSSIPAHSLSSPRHRATTPVVPRAKVSTGNPAKVFVRGCNALDIHLDHETTCAMSHGRRPNNKSLSPLLFPAANSQQQMPLLNLVQSRGRDQEMLHAGDQEALHCLY